MIELNDVPRAEALERMNRQNGSVRLTDPELADLRVTGACRTGDLEGFAQGVAAALNLTVVRDSDGTYLLTK